MRYWRTSGQIDPGYFVAALLRCCFGVVQVAGWQPLHGAGKGGVGGFPTPVLRETFAAGTSFKQSRSRDGWGATEGGFWMLELLTNGKKKCFKSSC